MRDRFDIDQVIKITGLGIHAEQADGGADFDVACSIAVKKIWKAKEYEDLEEQGKLLKLLCGVGAELWAITTIKSYSLGLPKKEFLEHPQKKRVESITLSRNGILYHARGRAFHDYHFGKEVFFTEKEAEAALKELRDKKG